MTTHQNPQVNLVNSSSTVTDFEVAAVTLALRAQIHEDFGPAWHTGCRLNFEPVSGVAADPGAWTLEVLDDADVSNALGYHEVVRGVPYMKVFARTTAQDGLGWPGVASHELCECLADPFVQRAIQVGASTFAAVEVCDPVERDLYDKNGVAVSNFVTERWFTGTGNEPLDFLGHVSSPRQLLPGGYMSYYVCGKGWTQQAASGAQIREHRMHNREVFEAD